MFCPWEPTDFLPSVWVEVFESFLVQHHADQLVPILIDLDPVRDYPVYIDCIKLLDYNMKAGAMLLAYPAQLLCWLNDALQTAQVQISEHHPSKYMMSLKVNTHPRLCHLPRCPELFKPNISSIRSSDIGTFISVSGTVIRTGAMKMLESERMYECAKCHERFPCCADIEMKNNTMAVPQSCFSKSCKGTTFTLLDEGRRCSDFQEIKIQEQVQKLDVGSIPRSLLVVLQDELTDCCKPGDDLVVSGILRRRWKPPSKDVRCEVEMFLQANNVSGSNDKKSNVHVTDELKEEFDTFWKNHAARPLEGRNSIIGSICPQMVGLFNVKLAVALTLIGGVQHMESGTRVRGESHMLLVGDPGTGKSQFLKYACKLSPRAVLTTGIGSTSAGLTVSAARDTGGEWILEAGALVLADGGLCCIDEFSAIRETDKATIHEAMEQQTLSVAKAGLVCKLNTMTTVFAACNPKGKYNPDADLSVNTAIAPPLLSRFDIVLVLLDTANPDWDKTVSSHILKARGTAAVEADEEEFQDVWSMAKLQAYIAYVKLRFLPKMSEDSQAVLTAYYQLQRGRESGSTSRTTIRMLESLVRLSQAHARLMFRDEVAVVDALTAVMLMECSQNTAPLLSLESSLHSSFPEDPTELYCQQEAELLRKLRIKPSLCEHH